MSLNSKELEVIVDLGNTLGYVGDELKQFVSDERMRIEKEKENEAQRAFELEKLKLHNAKEMDEQKNKAEEKRLEIEAERAKAEAEQKKLEIEAEMADWERRTKLELEERAAQDKKEQREFELKKLELQASQNARNTQPNMEGGGDNNGGRFNNNMRSLKLPPFNRYKDDLDSYLTRFERACQALDVPPNHWSTQLARLLQGAALDVYQRMSDRDVENYEILKMNLLKRFRLTEGGYKKTIQAK